MQVFVKVAVICSFCCEEKFMYMCNYYIFCFLSQFKNLTHYTQSPHREPF